MEDRIAARLEAAGERFMSLFDDGGGPSRPLASNVGKHRQVSQEVEARSQTAPEPSSSGRHSDSDSEYASEHTTDGGTQEFVFRGREVTAAGMDRTPAPQRKRKQADASATASSAKRDRPTSTPSTSAPRRSSGHKPTSAPAAPGSRPQSDGAVSREEFVEMQREVQKLGASALDKRTRQRLQAAELEKLGAKRQKGGRIPASIGLGMAKKQTERSQRAEEAAIEAGMLSRKALTQKKRRDARSAAKQADRGLLEAPNFRRGTMHLQKHRGRPGASASKSSPVNRTPSKRGRR